MPSAAANSDLIARLKAGDARAYEHLLREFGPRLLATANRMCRSDADAADVLQDAMILCIRNVADFKGDSAIYTWLHRIVVTTALMRLRKKKRRNEAAIEPLLPAYFDDGHRVGASGGTDWEESSQEIAQRRETRQIVRECIEQLPDSYRNVLLLRDIEGLDTSQTAEVLGQNDGVVKTRLHRARQALRTLLEPYVIGTKETQPK